MENRFTARWDVVLWLSIVIFDLPSMAQEPDAAAKPIRQLVDQLVSAFNEGKTEAVAALFVDEGELVDENGLVHQGRDQIQGLLKGFFEAFPGAKMTITSDATRVIGPVALDEGTRILTDANGVSSTLRYTATLAQTASGWRIASIRDYAEATLPTAGEKLQPLAWLIGDWVNEGTDGRVKIRYQWSEDKNFILGDYEMFQQGQLKGKTSQRIGWDPVLSKPRSWLFDSDGGFSEATWTEIEGGWLLRSNAVLPDGQTGAATLKIISQSESRFQLLGTDRVIGDVVEDNFELTVVKQPPKTEANVSR